MATDEKSLSFPQSGMNRDLHPSTLNEQQYTFALNANIESEDGNVNMRSNEHSNMKCIEFEGYKVIGYKNDLTSGNTYFFLTNPDNKTSKITYLRVIEDIDNITEEQMEAAISGNYQICSGMQTLIEDSVDDPCLNLSIYHPIKTIEIKVEKCGKCIYWTDGYNPPRYVIIEKALEPDDEGDIWYHYHGYKICEKDYDRDNFISENGCILACEKLRIFPLLEQPCIEPEQIAYGGSLRAGVYQFAVALCDEFGNEETNYSPLTNPVHIFDEHDITIKDGIWGQRTNLGIRLTVSNLDRQVNYFKIAVVQNTVGYNGETQPVVDYFIEGIHPITEKTIYYYSDLNNTRTTFEHIAYKRPVYNTSRGIASVDNKLLQYGLTAEKEWNLQPVVSLMGHFLQWQSSVSTGDLYKDGNACALYVGYMRDEVYPFSISFRCSTGYNTPGFVFIPAPFKDARKKASEESALSTSVESIDRYISNCYDNIRQYGWQYKNTSVDNGPLTDDMDVMLLNEDSDECKNEVTIGQTITVERILEDKPFNNFEFTIDMDESVSDLGRYISDNIMDIACGSDNAVMQELCDFITKYNQGSGNHAIQYPMDGIDFPEFPDGCGNITRQDSILEAPYDLIKNPVTDIKYRPLDEMQPISSDDIPMMSSDTGNKRYLLFINNDTKKNIETFIEQQWAQQDLDNNFVGGLCGDLIDKRSADALISVLAESLSIIESYPNTSGGDMYKPITNPKIINEAFVPFQSSVTAITSFAFPENRWCAKTSSNTNTARKDCYWGHGNLGDTLEHIEAVAVDIDDYFFSGLDTGISTDWAWSEVSYVSDDAGEAINRLLDSDDDGLRSNIGIAADRLAYKFYPKVSKNAIWIRIDRPSEWIDSDYNGEKAICLESFGKSLYGTADAASTNKVRISYWKDTSGTPLNYNVIDFEGQEEKRGSNSVIVGTDAHAISVIDDNFFTSNNISYFFIAVDNPVVVPTYYFSFREDKYCTYKEGIGHVDGKISTAILGASMLLGKTLVPYVIALRDKEIDKVVVKGDQLLLKATVVFAADCVSCGDKPINCAPRKYRYGEFGYYESSHKYPANFELYDSSRVRINPNRSYSGKEAEAAATIKQKMTEWYGSPLKDGNLDYYKGHTYGTIETSTTFCQQPIRHYRFPDNFHSQLMNSDIRLTEEGSEIYPVGVLINEDIINVFLDYAVDSGLITQDQRDTIIGYELYRGDRRLNKSVVGCGLGYDMYKYTDVGNNQENLYANYPYNDLGDDQFHYTTGQRVEYIKHPFNKDGNVWYSFLSPDLYFNKMEMPTEITIDGYMRGLSTGIYNVVDEHPKWTILSNKAYKMASTLASVESIAQLMYDVSQAAQLIAGGGVIGSSVGAVWFAATIPSILGKRAAYYGKYRYDWLNTFINNGPRYNFAWYYSSVGDYTSMYTLQSESEYLANSIRGLSTCKIIKSGLYPISDASSDNMLYINNIYREKNMFMSLGDTSFKTVYPTIIKSYDSSRVDDPGFTLSESAALKTLEFTKLKSYIASPYIRAKVYKPNQYGDIEDIKWISIGGKCNMTGGYKRIFGGDTFISKFAIKRKLPEFINNAFHIGDMIPFPYDDYRNIGFPKYFVNYDTGQDMLEYTDYETAHNRQSRFLGSSYFYPNRYSLYNLNAMDIEEKYIKGRFYLWYYGIPYFYVESDINCNFRLQGVEPHEWFYPAFSDYMWWTQEKNVSIERDNDFKISPIYSARNTLTPMILPATYERKFWDCAYQRPNGVIWSRSDISENSQTDPWLTYKPMDYHEFPTKNGSLIHMKRIESNQILARFEDQVSLHNAIDVMKERVSPNSTEIGTGGLFASRPLEYNTTDLGYAGTQSTEIVSSEFGHFWVDVKRAQVFMTDPNGRNLKELSVGIRHWLKKHLPFKILKYGIINVNTKEKMTYEDVDNKFIGLGLSLGWDNRYKRVFITKKDYIPVNNPAYYKYDGGRFFYDNKEVSLKNENYFKDVSFTLAYSCIKQEWISYYSFCPDYYLEQQSFFQTGLNYSKDSIEMGLWSHLMTNKSFQTFYGTTYPFILEVPVKEKFNGSILSSIEYELDARKYIDDVTYTLDRKVGLDSITVYNDTNNSGEMRLVPEEKNNMMQKAMYPITRDGYTEILDTEVYRRHKLNDFFNRVDDDRSDIPVWDKDDNDIIKEVNKEALNFRQNWLDRIRGSWLLMRIKKIISNRKIIFQWIISEDKPDNR